jgi:hypothetical protein
MVDPVNASQPAASAANERAAGTGASDSEQVRLNASDMAAALRQMQRISCCFATQFPELAAGLGPAPPVATSVDPVGAAATCPPIAVGSAGGAHQEQTALAVGTNPPQLPQQLQALYNRALNKIDQCADYGRVEMARLFTQALAPVMHGSLALVAHLTLCPEQPVPAAVSSEFLTMLQGVAAYAGAAGAASTYLAHYEHVPGEEWMRFFAAYASEALKTPAASGTDACHYRHVLGDGQIAEATARQRSLRNVNDQRRPHHHTHTAASGSGGGGANNRSSQGGHAGGNGGSGAPGGGYPKHPAAQLGGPSFHKMPKH